jgi:hypothetical protein
LKMLATTAAILKIMPLAATFLKKNVR